MRLTVSTGTNDDWLLETFGPSLDVDWSLSIGTHCAGSKLCTGDTTIMIVPQTILSAPDRCMARMLGKVLAW